MLRFVLFLFALGSIPAYAQKPAQDQSTPSRSAASVPPAALSPQVAEAEAAIVKSDWKSAQAALNPWLAAHPADPRALFDAAYVADAEGRLDDAAELYRRALAADPQSFEAHLSLGLLLARQNKLDDARSELARAAELDPGDAGPAMKARAWRALARIDSKSDPTQASGELLEALKLTPETTADTLLAATIADNARQTDAAEAAYRRVLAADPDSPTATAGLAHILIARKQYPDAEPLLRAALAQAPNDPALNAQLATVLVGEDKAEALPLVQKLHEAHPEDGAITRMLAQILADAGDYEGSDRLYVGLLKTAPNDPSLLVAHGQNLIRNLRYPAAFAAFEQATEAAPDDADAWSGLAFAASRLAKPDVTLHALTMRSKYLPELPSTYFLWATAYDSLHQRVQAAAYYHRFLEASAGKFPDQEWQARQRLVLLEKKP